ncbi:D-alanyl-D-alanine carboxypeptidase [hydrothermal vent metagenome]|uniref:D-alanyl-D-alanine carboxypeptidase n=1 Tax=hydrothermal vent metagenome TaxID=652676 RepID=A0A3B0RTX7_9ZZZZ
MRFFVFILGIFIILLPLNAGAAPAERYASIAVVESTGEVLHARYADQLRHPASLTKVMTLYLLFDAIERGDVGLDDYLRVSDKATKAKPSKLGLKKDTTISVENAIRALVTKSANDVAVVVAERLGGGEAKFAGMMTKQARLLGMSRTRFGNSSGLPDKRQTTTARDMAILAAAIRNDFRQYFHYFSLEKFIYKGRTYGNHNSLVGRVTGVDGLKTGYTNASGYNVVVTAGRDGERVIVVVFGGATATQRDSHANDLIKAAFAELNRRKTIPAETAVFAQIAVPTAAPVLPPAGLPEQIEQGSASKRGVQIIIEGQELLAAAVPPPGLANQWLIQVGAYSLRSQAEDRLQTISNLSLPALQAASPVIQSTTKNGKDLFRARFGGLKQKSATRACLSLTSQGQPCFPLASAR